MAVRADDVDLLRDRSLVERFQAGHDQSFEDLYRRYFARLHRFCARRLGGDLHEAEEVAQEAFVRAFGNLSRLGGERRFYPWLTVIASRLCVDANRRRDRAEPTADLDLGAADGGQDAVVEAADVIVLGDALERISPRHREVLHLREHRGWSYQQIAQHYDVTQGTVEALLFRARRALRKEFLALHGADTRLATLPVIGWLVRKLHAAQDRTTAWAGPALSPLAANVVSLAIIAGATTGVLAGPAAPAGTVARVASPPAPAAAVSAPVPATRAVAHVANGVRPAPAARLVVGNASVTSSSAARDRAAKNPVAADTPLLSLGADPGGVASWALRQVSRIERSWIGER